MAKLSRVLQNIFGSTAGTDEIAQIGSLAAGSPNYTTDLATIQALTQYLEGLYQLTNSASEPPRIQDINALYFLITSQLKYLFQSGIPEWISTEDYYTGSFCQVAGVIYVSQSGVSGTPNTGNDPTTDTGTNWLTLADVIQAELGLTASEAVFSDASGKLVSRALSGSGNVVLATGPSLSGPSISSPSMSTPSITGGGTVDGHPLAHAINIVETSNTIVIPAGVSSVAVTGCASGGNGGSGSGTQFGGGGGGGEWVFKKTLAVSPGETLTNTIGAHAANTTIAGSVSGTLLTLNHGADGAAGGGGGAGGSGGSGSAGGNGGQGSNASGALSSPGNTGMAGGGWASGQQNASGQNATGGGGGGSLGAGGNGSSSAYNSTPSYGGGGGGTGNGFAAGSGGSSILVIEW